MFISKKNCHPERSVLQRSRRTCFWVARDKPVLLNKCYKLQRHHIIKASANQAPPQLHPEQLTRKAFAAAAATIRKPPAPRFLKTYTSARFQKPPRLNNAA